MFERKVSKGRIVLAVGVASALAACGGENTGWQPEEYEPSELGDTREPIDIPPTESERPEVPSGPAVVGQNAESDLENTAGIAASACPGTNGTIEGTDDPDTMTFSDVDGEIAAPFAYVLGDGNDTFYVNSVSSYPEAQHCVVGGAGDDVFYVQRASGAGYSGEYSGNPTGLRIVGGLGRDTLYYGGVSYSSGSANYRPPFTFADFDCLYDEILVDEDGNNLVSTEVIEYPYFDAWSYYEYSANTYSNGTYHLVFDPIDGELWLAQNYYSEAYNVLLGTVDGEANASCIRVGTTPTAPVPPPVITIDEPPVEVIEVIQF